MSHIDIDFELEKIGLDRASYEMVRHDLDSKMAGLSQTDWKEIVDEYGIKLNYDTIRKAYTGVFGSYFTKMYDSQKKGTSNIRDIVGEQYTLKQQLKVEQRNINKVKNEFVKSISISEDICNAFKEYGITINIPSVCKERISDDSDKEMVICLSDWHIGYKNEHFNLEVAKYGINKFIDECIKYINIYGIKKANIIGLGDLIEGYFLRDNQGYDCEYLFTEQIPIVTNLLFEFSTKISEFCNVYFGTVGGNHGRLESDKKKSIKPDNANVIYTNTIRDMVAISKNRRIFVDVETCKDGEIVKTICGKTFKFVHGDELKRNDNVNMKNQISCDDTFYDFLVHGHLHTFSMNAESNGRYTIGTGCLFGSNRYSKKLGFGTCASQFLMVLNSDGTVEMMKDVQLY